MATMSVHNTGLLAITNIYKSHGWNVMNIHGIIIPGLGHEFGDLLCIRGNICHAINIKAGANGWPVERTISNGVHQIDEIVARVYGIPANMIFIMGQVRACRWAKSELVDGPSPSLSMGQVRACRWANTFFIPISAMRKKNHDWLQSRQLMDICK
jgi:hypothetical protein